MGDSGALALGFLLATLSVDGVLKTAAAITLVAPLLVLAVPILDTSFVVLKRLKYRRPPWRADHNHFYHRFMRIGFSQRRTAAYLHLWALMMAGYALLARFVPPRPRGDWDLERSLLLAGVGLLVIGARSGWSTRWRSSRAATCTRSACAASARTTSRRSRASRGGRRAREPPRSDGGRARGRERRAVASAMATLSDALRPASPDVPRASAQRASSSTCAVSALASRSASSSRSPDRAHAVGERAAGLGSKAIASASESSCSRPSRTSCSSTPPSGPSNIDHTGVPSTAASRFIVPPAETSTSASATRLRPSTVRSGTTTRSSPSARTSARCSVGAGEHDGLHALVGGGAAQHARQQRGLRAAEVERVGGRGAHDVEDLRALDAELGEHAAVGLEVGEVVLLLEARVADQLAPAGAVAREPLGRDRVRHEHAVRQPAVDVVLGGGPLVVEHRAVGDPQQPRDDRAGRSSRGRARGRSAAARAQREQPRDAVAGGERLVAAAHAAVAADDEMRVAPVLEQLDGVRQRPRRQRDVVTRRLEPLDERAQHDHVRRVGEVDPDPHGEWV